MTVEKTGRDQAALCALTRFGLGPRPGDLARIASDPRGAVKAELLVRDVALLPDPYLKSSKEYLVDLLERRTLRYLADGRALNDRHRAVVDLMAREGRMTPEQVKATRETKPRDRTAGAEDMAGKDMAGKDMAGKDMAAADMSGMDGDAPKRGKRKGGAGMEQDDLPDRPNSPLGEEAAARFVRARKCEIGFAERLVQFWANHFTVSRSGVAYLKWVAGSYEREAIRPNVLGRFSDLALAATRHPAMLRFLNNESSFGPNSRAGERRGRGLNENHARELMELHTVGVSGGYTQADVVALAKALTGWRSGKNLKAADFGRFVFEPRAHEPGDQTIMGKVYKAGGVEQATAAIEDLARKPATATHVARRLAIAFVADDPPQALVDRLARRFRDTDGDLREVSLELISADEAWDAPRAKMRSPQEFVFATTRALKDIPDPETLNGGLAALGQPFWGATSPKGYPIAGADWISPDAQTNRLDFAVDVASVYAADIDPNALAQDLLGDVMSDETRTAVKRAGSREQAMALLLMSPEMQRR